MLALCVVAVVLAVVSTAGCIYLWFENRDIAAAVVQHYQYWDEVTDKMIAQTRDVVNNHNGRINHLELSLGGIYTPFGYKKSEKA